MTTDVDPAEVSDSASAVLGAWLDDLAAPTPSPGGGAAAAVSLAVAASLVEMTIGYAPASTDRDAGLSAARDLRAAALRAVDRDSRASGALVAAFRAGAQGAALHAVLAEAATAAAEGLSVADGILGLLRWVADEGDPRLRADVVAAARLLVGAVGALCATVATNITAARAEGVDPEALHRWRLDIARGDAVAAEAGALADDAARLL